MAFRLVSRATSRFNRPEFVSAWWQAKIDILERELPQGPQLEGFLHHYLLGELGLRSNDPRATYEEWQDIRRRDRPRLSFRLRTTNEIGGPVLGLYENTEDERAYSRLLPGNPSRTTIHHLHQFTLMREAFGVPETLIEWGGGYGNMARITRHLDKPPTHVIIDLPWMLALQWVYLTHVFGREAVHVVCKGEPHYRDGKVNLTPTGLADTAPQADVFMAMFSLDECTKAAHDYVIGSNFLRAKRAFIGLQPNPHHNFFPDGPSLYERLKSVMTWHDGPIAGTMYGYK